MKECPADRKFVEYNSSKVWNCVAKCSTELYLYYSEKELKCYNNLFGSCPFYRKDNDEDNPQKIC